MAIYIYIFITDIWLFIYIYIYLSLINDRTLMLCLIAESPSLRLHGPSPAPAAYRGVLLRRLCRRRHVDAFVRLTAAAPSQRGDLGRLLAHHEYNYSVCFESSKHVKPEVGIGGGELHL